MRSLSHGQQCSESKHRKPTRLIHVDPRNGLQTCMHFQVHLYPIPPHPPPYLPSPKLYYGITQFSPSSSEKLEHPKCSSSFAPDSYRWALVIPAALWGWVFSLQVLEFPCANWWKWLNHIPSGIEKQKNSKRAYQLMVQPPKGSHFKDLMIRFMPFRWSHYKNESAMWV